MLYKLPHGSLEESNADDDPNGVTVGMVSTVPARVKSSVFSHLTTAIGQIPVVLTCPVIDADMPSIPEDSELPALAPSASASQQNGPDEWKPSDQFMPGERIEIDTDAMPLSDDDEPETTSLIFRPTAQQLKDLKIAHDNSGHPTASEFARMIKLGNGKPELVK